MKITPLEALKAIGAGFNYGWDLPARERLSERDSDELKGGLACIGGLSIITIAVVLTIKVVMLPFKILDKVLKK